MNDDFNTPETYSVLFDMAREVNRLKGEDDRRECDGVSSAEDFRRAGTAGAGADVFLQSGARRRMTVKLRKFDLDSA